MKYGTNAFCMENDRPISWRVMKFVGSPLSRSSEISSPDITGMSFNSLKFEVVLHDCVNKIQAETLNSAEQDQDSFLSLFIIIIPYYNNYEGRKKFLQIIKVLQNVFVILGSTYPQPLSGSSRMYISI